MVYSQTKIYVDQKIETTFDYLLNKDYVKNFFPDSSDGIIEVIGENDNPKFVEGEEFDLMNSDDEMIMTFRCKIANVEKNKAIIMNFRLVEVIDKEEGTLDDDMEATNFLQKFVGGKFGYHIFLEQKKDKVQITEIGMIETKHFFCKNIFQDHWTILQN